MRDIATIPPTMLDIGRLAPRSTAVTRIRVHINKVDNPENDTVGVAEIAALQPTAARTRCGSLADNSVAALVHSECTNHALVGTAALRESLPCMDGQRATVRPQLCAILDAFAVKYRPRPWLLNR